MKLIRYLIFIMCILSSACGGGTAGTGDIAGPDTRFYGTVATIDGQVLANAEITIADSGDSVYSDENGNFNLVTSLPDNDPQILVRSDNLEKIINIETLTSLNSEVKLSIVVDSPNSSIKLEAIEISVKENETSAIPASSSNSSISSSSSSSSRTESEIEPSTFSGTVVFEDGKPVSGAQIILRPQNIKSKTNSNGKFRFEAKIAAGNNSLDVKYESASGKVSLGNLPASKALAISLKLVVKRPLEVGASVSSPNPKVVLSVINISEKK